MKPYKHHFGLYTASHLRLLEALSRQNLPVLSEVPVDCGAKIFRIDLLVGGKLAVEVDGPSHNGRSDRDDARDKSIFTRYGIKTLRFSNSQVEKELPEVVQTIRSEWLKIGKPGGPF